ncbi:MAG TPA: 1-deoxy-D-xylulose-5-phosphate synthase [Candidatus Corynebacterium avicola]|uniref:1-deoxy-D-xylulose-5-phosphate synthase n=1 Tax=Candidatus Corynebacterium avicola TaxID=2838527 RepID=A0A9D1UMN3_9CORY|nr:1-deoxy-D-xylulose-5-phosphate synthase [Candidatus Corynebacterium avicola]
MTSTSILEGISSPDDLRSLTATELATLAGEIRAFLIEKVSATGGHLGPNLGVVELTIALHRVFDSPSDPIIFDTGHQAYVHKILTGRRDLFDTLRRRDGLSGYPARAESPHDWTESSHASAALSYADGLAKAFELTGKTGKTGQDGQNSRNVVAVVGDGALTGGMAWEALNNIADAEDRPLTIVVNDNGRSYSPTIGGLEHSLASMRVRPAYEKVTSRVENAVVPREIFGDLGLEYIGPVDGHDITALQDALGQARSHPGPVIVHALTRKGNGYPPAENDEDELMHSTGVIDPSTGRPVEDHSQDGSQNWTDIFAEELVRIGHRREDVVAITAAMTGPTGLARFAGEFPDRTFDVGIAEQYALTSAAGLALGGLHPVVAVYSTFLNRAFDQLLMDVGLLHLPVTLVLDRAGVTGPDGASHNGMWDLTLTGVVPGIHVAAPRDGHRLTDALHRCLAVTDGPSVVRFPKGTAPQDVPAVRSTDDYDVLHESDRTGGTDGTDGTEGTEAGQDVLVVSYGTLTDLAFAAADELERSGPRVRVVDPLWVTPVSHTLVDLVGESDLVVTVEDNGVHGGAGQMLHRAVTGADISTPVRYLGIAQRFLDHGTRSEVLADVGLDEESVRRQVAGWAAVSVETVDDDR